MDMCVLTILFFVSFFRLHTISINYIMLLFFFLLFNTHVTNIRSITTSIWSCCSMHIKLCGSGGGGMGGLVCPPSDELNGIREFFLHVCEYGQFTKPRRREKKKKNRTVNKARRHSVALKRISPASLFFFFCSTSFSDGDRGIDLAPEKKRRKSRVIAAWTCLKHFKVTKKTKKQKEGSFIEAEKNRTGTVSQWVQYGAASFITGVPDWHKVDFSVASTKQHKRNTTILIIIIIAQHKYSCKVQARVSDQTWCKLTEANWVKKQKIQNKIKIRRNEKSYVAGYTVIWFVRDCLTTKKKNNPSVFFQNVHLSEAQISLITRRERVLGGCQISAYVVSAWDWILAELGTFHGPGVMGAFLLVVVPLQLGSWMLLLEPLGSFLFASSGAPWCLLSRYSLSPFSLPLLRLRVPPSASDPALSLCAWEGGFCAAASCSALLFFLWRSLVP